MTTTTGGNFLDAPVSNFAMPVFTRAAICIAAASWLTATSAFARDPAGAPSSVDRDLSIDSVSLAIRTRGRVAHTTMTVVVENHTGDWHEAFVDLELPAEAAVTGLSMDVGTTRHRPRMAGRIADRDEAADVYQAIVDRVRDPALLEDLGHGHYRLRIFPVPGRDTKTVVITYEHLVSQVDTRARYHVHPPVLLGGSGRIRRLAVTVDGRTEHRGPWSSDEPLSIERRTDALPEVAVRYARHDGQVYYRAELVIDSSIEREAPDGAVIAVDTSFTMQRAYAEAIAGVNRLSASLRDAGPVHLVRGDVAASDCADVRCLSGIEPAGAANLERLLEAAVDRAESMAGSVAIILVTDGRRSVGAGERELIRQVRRLPSRISVHVLAAGRFRRGFLSRLARAGNGHLARGADRLIERLREPVVTDLQITTESGRTGASGPAGLFSAELGRPFAVYGRLLSSSAELRVRGRIENSSFERGVALARPAPAASSDSSVLNGWMRAGPPEQTRELEGVSAMTPGEAFIVLETESDYEALETRDVPRTGRTRARTAPVPRIRIGHATVAGDLDKNMLRRYIGQKRRRIRHCYNRALVREPSVEGTVTVQWTILPNGRSQDVVVASDIDDDELSACIAGIHRRIRFPDARGGGHIRVRYPYRFVAPKRRRAELSVGDEADVLAHHVESGDDARAAAALADIRAKLDGKPARALLPYLSAPSVRAHFGAAFREAALDRLDQPNPPRGLWAAVASSFARDQPRRLVPHLGHRDPGVGDARQILHALIDDGHTDLSLELARAWHNGPITTREMRRVLDGRLRAALPTRWFFVLVRLVDGDPNEVFAMDDLIDVSRQLGLDRLAADRILDRCSADSLPCRRWLTSDLDDSRLRNRLDWLVAPRLAHLERSRATESEVRELAALLDLVGRPGYAVRVRAELSDFTAARQ